jgi:hypothetical protein
MKNDKQINVVIDKQINDKQINDKQINDKQINDKQINDKIELMNFNNGWNDKNEQLLISIGENAASYKWMHEASSNYHNTVYNITSIALIVLSSLLSIQTLFPNESCANLVDNNANNVTFVVVITKQVVLYIVTILSFLQSFLNSQVLSQKHFFASGLFSELYHDIQEQMCMFRKDRMNAKQHVSACLKKYDSLVVNNPDINSYINKKFKKTFGGNGISLPSIIDKVQKIQIVKEYDNDVPVRQVSNPPVRQVPNSPQGNSNLAEINNVFQISGDISDIELDYLKSKKFEHEYNRFLNHTEETD